MGVWDKTMSTSFLAINCNTVWHWHDMTTVYTVVKVGLKSFPPSSAAKH